MKVQQLVLDIWQNVQDPYDPYVDCTGKVFTHTF